METLSTIFDISPPNLYGFPYKSITNLACDRFQGIFSVGLSSGHIKMYFFITLRHYHIYYSWTLNGTSRFIKLPEKYTVTHIQFLQNQGLISAAVKSEKNICIMIWAINTGKQICDPIILPNKDEYFLLSVL